MTSLLTLDTLEKRYGQYIAVSDVSFNVAVGERLAVIGPNGAGKSTLFGMIAGEHDLTAGSIKYGGTDITSWRPSRRAAHGIARTFQTARMFGSLSVRENMLISMMGAGQTGSKWWRRFRATKASTEVIDELLADANLSDKSSVEARVLAQGDRKSLELVMAVAQRPKLLLLDEPTAGMSLEDAAAAIQLVRKLQEMFTEMAVIVTAHDMQVIFALSDRVILMAQGKVVLDDEPNVVAENPITRDIYLGLSK